MGRHRLTWLDVFADAPLRGNPLAVVHDADDLDDATMLAFARETKLSESTFVQAATEPGADYRNRIFDPRGELRFAGHPLAGRGRRRRAASRGDGAPQVLVPVHADALARASPDFDRIEPLLDRFEAITLYLAACDLEADRARTRLRPHARHGGRTRGPARPPGPSWPTRTPAPVSRHWRSTRASRWVGPHASPAR